MMSLVHEPETSNLVCVFWLYMEMRIDVSIDKGGPVIWGSPFLRTVP